MKFPRIQILSDKKSFNDFFEIDTKGKWREYSAAAVSIISTMVANVERSLIDIDVVLYGTKQGAYTDFDRNPFVQLLQRDGHYHPTTKKLSDFDNRDVGVTGRLIEFNGFAYDKNRRKIEALGRICVNINEEKQVVDFLGLLFYKSSGDTNHKTGEFAEPIRWRGEMLPPTKSLLVANSYIPRKWAGDLNVVQMFRKFGNACHRYTQLILQHRNEKPVDFMLLTKQRRRKDFDPDKPFNLVDQLVNNCDVTTDDCAAHLDNHASGLFQNSKVLLSESWHHRKIFSEYWSVFLDHSLDASTTYSVYGILNDAESYYHQLYEMNRSFDDQLIPFIESNKLRTFIYE
jgi:hypothetical protein